MDQASAPALCAATDDERELVRLARAGDEEAFGRLMRAHHEPLFRLVFGIVRHEQDARELCQDTWVIVWQRLASFRGDAKFSTWLHPIGVRRAIDHLRKRRRWYDRFLPFVAPRTEARAEPADAFEPADPGPDARARLEQAERHARFEQLLATLPPDQRAALALREVEGLSYQEIARLLRCRPGTVMSRLFHARRRLARNLKDLPCD